MIEPDPDGKMSRKVGASRRCTDAGVRSDRAPETAKANARADQRRVLPRGRIDGRRSDGFERTLRRTKSELSSLMAAAGSNDVDDRERRSREERMSGRV